MEQEIEIDSESQQWSERGIQEESVGQASKEKERGNEAINEKERK